MPRIEGNFAVGRIVVDDGDYITVSPDPAGEILWYVLDDGSRMKLEFPTEAPEGLAEDKDWRDYIRMVPEHLVEVAA